MLHETFHFLIAAIAAYVIGGVLLTGGLIRISK